MSYVTHFSVPQKSSEPVALAEVAASAFKQENGLKLVAAGFDQKRGWGVRVFDKVDEALPDHITLDTEGTGSCVTRDVPVFQGV